MNPSAIWWLFRTVEERGFVAAIASFEATPPKIKLIRYAALKRRSSTTALETRLLSGFHAAKEEVRLSPDLIVGR